jgi:septal ring-binding cell division protein DamX
LLKKLAISPAEPAEIEPVAAVTLPPIAVSEDARPSAEISTPSGGGWRWLLGGIALLLASALSMTMFYVSSQGAARLHWNWQALLAGNNPMTNDVVAATIPSVTASVAATPASAPSAAASMPAAAASAPTTVASGAANAIEPVEAVVETLIETASEPAPLAHRPFELLIGQGWVQKMPRGTFLVQHTAVPTYQEALLWMQRHPDLGSAQVVATYLPTQKLPHYVIVSGPFVSLAEAKVFIGQRVMPKDSWVRSALSMKEQFTPTPAAGDAGKRKEKNG